jgi:hypothetical protein
MPNIAIILLEGFSNQEQASGTSYKVPTWKVTDDSEKEKIRNTQKMF